MNVYLCRLGYIDAAIEADRRIRKGEHQHCCARCLVWYFPLHRDEHAEEFGHIPEPSRYDRPSPNVREAKRAACDDCQWLGKRARSPRVVPSEGD